MLAKRFANPLINYSGLSPPQPPPPPPPFPHTDPSTAWSIHTQDWEIRHRSYVENFAQILEFTDWPRPQTVFRSLVLRLVLGLGLVHYSVGQSVSLDGPKKTGKLTIFLHRARVLKISLIVGFTYDSCTKNPFKSQPLSMIISIHSVHFCQVFSSSLSLA